MRKLLIVLFLFSYSSIFSQTWDHVIKKSNYISYFEMDYLGPTVVVYTLLNGGGDCSRDKFDFKNDRKSIRTAADMDYYKSGWDRGHLVPAEDFAYDCKLIEQTFRYYNCVPQHPKLNRGSWKKVEGEIRDISRNRKVVVICVNIFGTNYLSGSRVGIPKECIKLVWDFNTGKPIAGWVFTNNSSARVVKKSPQKIIEEKKLSNIGGILSSILQKSN